MAELTLEQRRALARARARARARQEQEQAAQPQQPNPAMQREAARYAARRNFQRGAMPFGLGYLTVPLQNMVLDPARREALGRSAQGVVRDVQQIPSLNAGRLASDTAQAVEQGVRNLPQTAAAVATHLPQIARAATYGPFVDEEQAQRRLDLARLQGDQQGQQQAASEANAQTAGIGLNVAGPLVLGSNPSLLRAGATAAAMDAPFALSRNSEQPLQQRLPGALTEIGAAGLFGAGLQGVANRMGDAATRRETAIGNVRTRAAEFDRAGVRPFLAAVRGSSQGAGATDSIAAPLTMGTAENIVGGNARRNLSGSIQDVRSSADRLANRFGEPSTDVLSGEAVQQGIRRYSRGGGEPPSPEAMADPWNVPISEMSMKDRADALYNPTFRALEYDAQQQMIGGVQGEVLTLANTQRTMDEIVNSLSGTRTRSRLTNERLQTMVDEMAADLRDGTLSFSDMRRWRTTIREMQGDEQLRQGISRAELQRIEGALSSDIYQSADNIGGQAAQDLRKIDRWYQQESRIIDDMLSHYYGADGGEATFRRILQDARPGGNIRRIEALRERLRDHEWRTLATSIINDLGRPPKARAHLGDFDLEEFVTKYQNISPAARRALFGGRAMGSLAEDLDNLQRVAGYMKEVRGFTNWSRSGQSAQNFGMMSAVATAGAAAFGGNIFPALGVALGAILIRLNGEILTNPRLVRWIVQAPKAGRNATTARAHLSRLTEIAARDPAVAALLAAEISPASGGQSPAPPSQRRQTAVPLQ